MLKHLGKEPVQMERVKSLEREIKGQMKEVGEWEGRRMEVK